MTSTHTCRAHRGAATIALLILALSSAGCRSLTTSPISGSEGETTAPSLAPAPLLRPSEFPPPTAAANSAPSDEEEADEGDVEESAASLRGDDPSPEDDPADAAEFRGDSRDNESAGFGAAGAAAKASDESGLSLFKPSEEMIVRGQGGNTLLAQDGGRHSRGPLGVSGQVDGEVMQASGHAFPPPPDGGGSSPVVPGGVMLAQGTTPAPGTSSPYTPPQGTASPYAPAAPPPSPYAAQPMAPAPQGGYLPPPYTPPAMEPLPTAPSLEGVPSLLGPEFDGTAGLLQPPAYVPRTRTADIFINGTPARTGRIMLGGAVNSDAGVTGQLMVEERNFDILRWPTSFPDLFSGTAFRGAGQTLRLEAVPGSVFQRYTAQFVEPYLFGYLPISMSVSGFLFDRRFRDWDEERMGGNLRFGYRLTPDLSLSSGLRAERVNLHRPRIAGVPEVEEFLGRSELYSGNVRLTHDTRDSPFAASEGHLLEMTYEQVFGSYDYPRAEIDYRRYFLLRERGDGSGRQTLALTHRLGYTGPDTPVFENFFAGGFATMRGFEFRGASPTVGGMQIGGRFQFLGSAEYLFPLTADDMLRGVLFVDYGTVEREVRMSSENFRVAPGFGFRVALPALGPAPLAFDFGFPVAMADGDERQVFSFYMGFTR